MLPWQNTTAHNEREAFIAAWQEGEETVAALAQHFGVSRKTAHKFINRFRAAGADGLLDRSRAPRAPHNATPQEVVDLLIQAKRADAALGPKKLVPLLRAAYPTSAGPLPAPRAASSIGPVSSAAGGVGAARPRGTTPSSKPFTPTTAGAPTSRAGSAPATASASTPSPSRTPAPVTCSPVRRCAVPPSARSVPSSSAPSASTDCPSSSAPTTGRLSPAPPSAA